MHGVAVYGLHLCWFGGVFFFSFFLTITLTASTQKLCFILLETAENHCCPKEFTIPAIAFTEFCPNAFKRSIWKESKRYYIILLFFFFFNADINFRIFSKVPSAPHIPWGTLFPVSPTLKPLTLITFRNPGSWSVLQQVPSSQIDYRAVHATLFPSSFPSGLISHTPTWWKFLRMVIFRGQIFFFTGNPSLSTWR